MKTQTIKYDHKPLPQLTKADSIAVIGKRWFERTNGNTYHSVRVRLNGEEIGYIPFKYGYERQYEQTALEIIKQHVATNVSWLYQLQESGATLVNEVIDVKRKKDL